MFCWVYPTACKTHKHDCPTLKESLSKKKFFFNPCLKNLAQKEQETYANSIIMPVCVFERKECLDFSSSITGTSSTPGFNRMKDQKLRLTEFVKITGCKQFLLIEGKHRYTFKILNHIFYQCRSI